MWPAPLDGIIDANERVRARMDGRGSPPPDWQPGRVWKFPTPKLPVNSVKSRTYRIPNSAVWHLASCVDPVDPPPWWSQRWTTGEEITLPAGPVEWWAVTGDPDALLAACRHVRRLNPEGHDGDVGGWTLDDDGPWIGSLGGANDEDTLHWTDADLISRPVPASCAPALGLPADVPTVPGTWRPPYHWPLPIPGLPPGRRNRRWQPVIAPWVSRPG